MIKKIFYKSIGISALSTLLYIPVSTAAPITQFTFNTSIVEVDVISGSPPELGVGDNVSGHILIDDTDFIDPPAILGNVGEYDFSGPVSYGYAQEAIPGWQQSTSYDVRVELANNLSITSTLLADLPPSVSAEFPGFSLSVGDVVDAVYFDVNKGDSEFRLLFIYTDLSVVQDLGSAITPQIVDFDKAFTDFVYGKFSAGASDNSGELWEAFGAIHPSQVSAVPIPAAAWLFGSGLLGLIGFARKRIS